jgi:CheY-like chemotaxis protein
VQRIEEYSSAPHALVVDDEPAIREVMTLFLEAKGYEVETAENGPQALRLFPSHEWAVVITDRMMPGMSGDELAASIRNFDAKIPIILVSGQLFDREGGFAFDAVLPKPFSAVSLFAALETATKTN